MQPLSRAACGCLCCIGITRRLPGNEVRRESPGTAWPTTESPATAASPTRELPWATEARRPRATHRGLVFVEHLVIAAERDAEDDGRDVLEAVNPLLAFRSLAPDVEQPAGETGKLHVVGGGAPAGVRTLVKQAAWGRGLYPQRASQGASLRALRADRRVPEIGRAHV